METASKSKMIIYINKYTYKTIYKKIPSYGLLSEKANTWNSSGMDSNITCRLDFLPTSWPVFKGSQLSEQFPILRTFLYFLFKPFFDIVI